MENTLTTDQSAAICRHMNEDHADAVAAYARTYAKLPSVKAAEMLSMDRDAMELAVDTGAERIVTRVVFDHVLAGPDDARRTLIAMAMPASR